MDQTEAQRAGREACYCPEMPGCHWHKAPQREAAHRLLDELIDGANPEAQLLALTNLQRACELARKEGQRKRPVCQTGPNDRRKQ